MEQLKHLYHFTSGDNFEDVLVISNSIDKALELIKKSQEENEFDEPHQFEEGCLNFKVRVYPEEKEGVKEHHYVRDAAWT